MLNSPAMQVFAESQAFTGFQVLEEQLHAWHEGKKVPWDWWQKTYNNTLIIGGMRGGSKLWRHTFSNEPGNDVTRYFTAKKALYHDTYSTTTDPQKALGEAMSSHAYRAGLVKDKRAKKLAGHINIQKSYRCN